MDNDFTHLKDWGDYQSFNVENKRNQWIIHKGYKVIRIICPRDKIPEDDIILKQLKEAREKLKKENIIYITWD